MELNAKTIIGAIVLVVILLFATGIIELSTEEETGGGQKTQTTIAEAKADNSQQLSSIIKKIGEENPDRIIDTGETLIFILPTKDAVEFKKDGSEISSIINILAKPRTDLTSIAFKMLECGQNKPDEEDCKKQVPNVEDNLAGVMHLGYIKRTAKTSAYNSDRFEIIIPKQETRQPPSLPEGVVPGVELARQQANQKQSEAAQVVTAVQQPSPQPQSQQPAGQIPPGVVAGAELAGQAQTQQPTQPQAGVDAVSQPQTGTTATLQTAAVAATGNIISVGGGTCR